MLNKRFISLATILTILSWQHVNAMHDINNNVQIQEQVNNVVCGICGKDDIKRMFKHTSIEQGSPCAIAWPNSISNGAHEACHLKIKISYQSITRVLDTLDQEFAEYLYRKCFGTIQRTIRKSSSFNIIDFLNMKSLCQLTYLFNRQGAAVIAQQLDDKIEEIKMNQEADNRMIYLLGVYRPRLLGEAATIQRRVRNNDEKLERLNSAKLSLDHLSSNAQDIFLKLMKSREYDKIR